jgi:lysophospholipase L1-like esterase
MGDSITFGQYIEPSLRWTDIIKSDLEKKFLSTDKHLNFLNCGVSGETTVMGLLRFARDVQENKPNIMTLQFGLNDCNCWLTDKGLPRVSASCFKANLMEMVTRAKHFGCQSIILVTNHVTLRDGLMLNGERYEDANARYSKIIRDVAKETQVSLCDIRSIFEQFSKNELKEFLLAHPDLLHLSTKGHQVYARAILPFIEKAIDEVLVMNKQYCFKNEEKKE